MNFTSTEKEFEIGRTLSEEYERTIKLAENFAVRDYVDRLAQKLVRNSDAQVAITFKVAEEVNGRAIPGGFVYINRTS